MGASLACGLLQSEADIVDAVFIMLILALYGATHGIVQGVQRLLGSSR
jgi:hypothetical protein